MVGERRRVRISPLVHPGGALTRPARAFESAERLSAPNPGVATETAMRCLGFESARQIADFQEVPRFPRDTRGGRKAQTVNEKRPLYEAFLRTPCTRPFRSVGGPLSGCADGCAIDTGRSPGRAKTAFSGLPAGYKNSSPASWALRGDPWAARPGRAGRDRSAANCGRAR